MIRNISWLRVFDSWERSGSGESSARLWEETILTRAHAWTGCRRWVYCRVTQILLSAYPFSGSTGWERIVLVSNAKIWRTLLCNYQPKKLAYVAWYNELIHVLISNRANRFRRQSFWLVLETCRIRISAWTNTVSLKFFVVFLSSSKQMLRLYHEIGYDCFYIVSSS